MLRLLTAFRAVSYEEAALVIGGFASIDNVLKAQQRGNIRLDRQIRARVPSSPSDAGRGELTLSVQMKSHSEVLQLARERDPRESLAEYPLFAVRNAAGVAESETQRCGVRQSLRRRRRRHTDLVPKSQARRLSRAKPSQAKYSSCSPGTFVIAIIICTKWTKTRRRPSLDLKQGKPPMERAIEQPAAASLRGPSPIMSRQLRQSGPAVTHGGLGVRRSGSTL